MSKESPSLSKETEKKLEKEFTVGLSSNIPAIVTYAIILSNPSSYSHCSSESSSYQWGEITLISQIVHLGVFILIIFPLRIKSEIMQAKGECTKKNSYESIVGIIKLLFLALHLTCFGGICYAYDQNEGCGRLEKLFLSTIIITPTILGIIIICVLLDVISEKKPKDDKEKNENNTNIVGNEDKNQKKSNNNEEDQKNQHQEIL